MKGPEITSAEIELGWEMVREMVEVASHRPTRTERERVGAMKTIKMLVGALYYLPQLKGAEKGVRRNLAADEAVIADIEKYGSLPKAVAAHIAIGKLSRGTTARSHTERSRLVQKHKK